MALLMKGNICPLKDFYKNVCNSFAHNIQLETTEMSMARRQINCGIQWCIIEQSKGRNC
jgi:hypothetical protein